MALRQILVKNTNSSMALRQILVKNTDSLRQIQRRFISQDHFGNPKFGVPIEESISTYSRRISEPILRNSAGFLRRFYFNNSGLFHSPIGVGLALFLFGCGALLGISNGKWVTVPHAERRRFILFYNIVEKFIGKYLPDAYMKFELYALPPFHPDCTAARRIFQDIINQAYPDETEFRRLIVVNSPFKPWAVSVARFRKMYVTTGLLYHYGSKEAMIATNVGREVGHDLASHLEEHVSKIISTTSVIGMSLILFTQSTYIRSKFPPLEKFMRIRLLPSITILGAVGLLSYLVVMKHRRETEVEADYIGLMLASSAGYDPREGLQFAAYGADDENTGVLAELFQQIPSCQERSLRLARPHIINQALSRYRRAIEPPDDAKKDSN